MEDQGITMWLPTVAWLVFFVLMMYLIVFLPQKRRDKKAKEMLDSMQVGTRS